MEVDFSCKDKVYLGGTTLQATWRKPLIDNIQVDYFNPEYDGNDWTPEYNFVEEQEKKIKCNIHLYVVAKEIHFPLSVFLISEVIESVHNHKKFTIFHVLPDGFEEQQLRSLECVVNMVKKHGGIGYIDNDLMRTAHVINYSFKQ